MFKLTKFSILLLLIVILFLANPCFAAESILPNPENVENCNCSSLANASDACQLACKKQTGNYELNDFTRIAIVISNIILGLVGSLALLAFIVGGLMWLLSGGKAELVERGKQTIIGAVVGLAIVFTSFMIIQLVFTALNIPKTDKGEWSTSGWTSGWPKN
ncbi:MAG: hypothetical protein UU95_C0031G0002 [Parcubacteria group bacterium GW2011_GWC2_42_12]|uniref:DUF4190 domain-containing protein n=2 Tax=Candidatus Falkowiibacteriota TaxID=1752728 RepID=A0A1F5SA73_9BACT|nr:MAG: hypothetical protein UU43_C0001G0059 [Candidatus Falkowbacteria bacterium GW2011_GWA2_41_14]KKS33440.1 MAG: hypothetical protein UU95_C0031G0002 [Parcubacteria group bacterium GW2011_GWC2_42_12]OGF23594.1 MAG: hypothetical protein A3D45_00580 [Candidatus Falkowbacteria bacterium RIFCSPHIGHO2_02_FULL_42_9]